MKKSYSKPLIKKMIKGAAGDYKEFQEVHTVFIKHGVVDVPIGMAPEEMQINQRMFLNKIPVYFIKDKLQQLYDAELKYLKARNIGYTEDLFIKNMKNYLTEISLNRDFPTDQIRAEIFLKFLDEQEKRISKPEMKDNKIPDFSSLLNFSKGNTSQKTIDDILIQCKESLSGINFNLMSYAALYLIFFDKYNNMFKRSTSFSDVQKLLDEYFNMNTRKYKPCKIKNKVKELKSKYKWIEAL